MHESRIKLGPLFKSRGSVLSFDIFNIHTKKYSGGHDPSVKIKCKITGWQVFFFSKTMAGKELIYNKEKRL